MPELRWTRWPVDNLEALITGRFGQSSPNPPWSPQRPHMGVDIGVVTGTPVYAPAAGTIVRPTNDGSFGIAVCISHNSTPRRYSLYAHLSQAFVGIGEAIRSGDVIGLSGATGFVSGAHLHWQLCDSPTFPRDLSRNFDPLSVPFEEEDDMGMTPEERKLFEDLMLSVHSGNEEAGLTREKRLENARYRIRQRADSTLPAEERDDSLESLIESVNSDIDTHTANHPGGGSTGLRQHDHIMSRTGVVGTVTDQIVD